MTIKIEKISEEKEKLSFIVKGINNSLINAIRRSVLEVPTLAIDSVEFYKNDSALYDEILAHRLGLLPLRATKTFVPRQKCGCDGKGCLKCTAAFKLKAKGPGTIYAKDLNSKGVEVVYPEMPLVFLEKDQEIDLSAEAILGIGKEHAKFTPGLLWFNSYPLIEIGPCTDVEDFVKICPKKAISIKDKKISIDPLKCDICGACIEFSKKKEKCSIKITPSTEDFIIYIESFGQTKPEEIFTDAIEVINENLNDLIKAIKKFK